MSKADKRARKRENKTVARHERAEATKRARRRRSVRSTLVVGVVVAGAVAGFSLLRSGGGDDDASPKVACGGTVPKAASVEKKTYEAAPEMTIDPEKRYEATIETSCGDIVVELDSKAAPLAVNNFVFLAKDAFYDGLTWHRVVRDFVIQGGDPKGDGTGGPGYSFADELPDTDYQPGDLAMANSGKDTNGSQFFILTAKQPRDISQHGHTRFGKVTEGLDVAREIEALAPEGAGGDGPPSTPAYIVRVRIRTLPS